jgi:multisubunit Na+/H+ antiporter MnhB subunit
MNSVILKMSVNVLKPLFLVVSIWLLLRGHNYPGGGFIGGLIAGSALIFKPLAFEDAPKTLQQSTRGLPFLAAGMASVFLSAILPLIKEGFLLKGLWLKGLEAWLPASLKLGTPLLFDLGVYFTVIGFIYLIFTSIMEEWQWK